jgi:hypothetical protein
MSQPEQVLQKLSGVEVCPLRAKPVREGLGALEIRDRPERLSRREIPCRQHAVAIIGAKRLGELGLYSDGLPVLEAYQ